MITLLERNKMRKVKNYITRVKNAIISCITLIKNANLKQVFNIRKNNNKSIYTDFAPTDSLQGDEESIRALDWALHNPKITNIALTGPYGSGKSSVIASYCRLHPKCRAINISLATFDGNTWDKIYELLKKPDNDWTQADIHELKTKLEHGIQADLNELEDELERGILKQLFYKVNADRIPLSRYRKLHHFSIIKYLLGVVASILIAVAAAYLLLPETLSVLATNFVHRFDSFISIVKLISSLVVAIIGISGVVRFIMTKFTIKEISVGDASVQGEVISTDSVFNKNIDEILYFFERTRYDVVFIEDLDRFNTTSIFIKLREINKILNQYEIIKRRIVFVYAVKDDLFEKEIERTKFFDFVIPVIPVINSTNSGEKMRELLGKGDRKDENREYPDHNISEKFITLVSPYISDMRILISIINEFWMYKRTLINGLKDQLNDECLLALIIYKNLYPQDFALLEAESGNIKDAFENKKMAIKHAQENLESTRKQLEYVQKDTLNSIKELKIIILSAILENKGIITRIVISGEAYSYSQLLSDDFSFDLLRKAKINVYYIEEGYYYEQSMSAITDLEESSEVFKELFSRYDAQCALKNKQHEETLSEFEKIDRAIMRIKDNTLQQLIETNSIEDVLPRDVRKNDLLVFLLRHGYINESYADYINYFHPGSISKEELNFILSVRNHNGFNDFVFTITHCDNVCERLFDYEFEQPETLNFDLLDFLLNTPEQGNKLQRIIKQITNRTELSHNFIKGYIERNKNTEQFIQIICHESHYIWEDIAYDEQLTNETKDKYFKMIIKNCAVEDIFENDYVLEDEESSEIKKYFENDMDILLKLSDVPVLHLENLIDKLDLHFYKLNIDGVNLGILDFVIKGKYYILNSYMMQTIFSLKKPESLDYLFCFNYHCVREFGCEELLDYIYEDFPSYIQDFVLNIESNTEEKQEDVEDIIERLFDVSLIDMCIAVIEKEHLAYWEKLTDCLVDYVDEEKKEIWDYLLLNLRTGVSWYNYLTYHNLFGLTSELFNYVNNNMYTLVEESSDCIPEDIIVIELMEENLTNESFKLLLSKYKVSDFERTLTKFDVSKLKIMIDIHYFDFSKERYIELKDISYELAERFALANKDEFIQIVDECELSIDEVKAYLRTCSFNVQERRQIILCIDEVDEELAQYIRNFESSLSKECVEAAWNILKQEDRYELLYNQLNVFTMDELADKFGVIGGDYRQLAKRSKHKYKLWDDDFGFNRRLCEKLLDKNYLSSCRIEGKNITGFVKEKTG